MPAADYSPRRRRVADALALLLVVAALASVAGERSGGSPAESLSAAEAAVLLSGGSVAVTSAGTRPDHDGARANRDRAVTRATFRRLAASQTRPLARWAAVERLDRRIRARTIFYPFGGPDAAFPLALFPWARDFILVGLEPVLDGAGHDPLRLPDARLLVGAVPAALTDLSGKGFFVTRTMQTEDEQGRFPGVLPIVLASVAAAQGEVDAIEYVRAASTDTLEVVDRATLMRSSRTTMRPSGVRVRFHSRGGGEEKTILYLRHPLGDRSLGEHRILESLLGGRDYAVFCKAGQYFMHGAHGPGFDAVMRLALGGSAILQDDTCVPLRAFDRAAWDLTFFGDYKPARMYAHMLQPELAAIYADRRAIRPVPQVAGYGGRTNLMLGVRR